MLSDCVLLRGAVKAKQASPIPKGEGRALRRARNVVKKWLSQEHSRSVVRISGTDREIRDAIEQNRYERACALIVADKLRNS